MPKIVRVRVDDTATVTVTGGTEYDRQTTDIDIEQVNRDRLDGKAQQGIDVLTADFAAVDGLASLADAKPILKHMLRATIALLRLQVRQFDSEGV